MAVTTAPTNAAAWHPLLPLLAVMVCIASLNVFGSFLIPGGRPVGSDAPEAAPGAGGPSPGGWWESSSSAVIAMASGYGLGVYETFVGSLRAMGYRGRIILGVSPDPPPDLREYLRRMDVTAMEVPIAANCTYAGHIREDGHPSTDQVCFEEYPDYKLSRGRFPLARDWLLECGKCAGGVMLTDVRDAYFQFDPFMYPFGDRPMERRPGELVVFQEHPNITTDHWLARIPVEKCRGVDIGGRPMLCNGSIMGTRRGILDYVDSMVREFDHWNERSECRSDMTGDDQSIHNYLFYTGRLGNAASVPHRTGPIHVVGWQADRIFRAAIEEAKARGHGEAAESFVNRRGFVSWDGDRPAAGSAAAAWLPPEHGLIDNETGFITNLDGRPSPQVHQFDRFGPSFPIEKLLERLREGMRRVETE